jgi:DNA-binding transcriptional LysR family regulator
MIPNASDLVYFVEAATAQNLSRAAERLGMSQPSLTLAIQRLELSVGVPLLIRSKKGVSLTQAGKQLLSQTRVLLQNWESVKEKTLSSHKEIQGFYSLGCHPSVALYSLPKLLPDLMDQFPRLEIKLVHDLSRRITESVVSMELDMGIVVNPTKHPDLVIKKLCKDEVALWVGPDKRKSGDPTSGEGVLICDPDLLQAQDLMRKMKKSPIKYRRVITSSSLEVIAHLVASGAGMGILPGRVATRDPSAKLVQLEGSPMFEDDICLAYRVENREVKAIQKLAEKISFVFQS